ncbi:hypothetical protein [Chelativorans alearense]|uniref:hypothetical protein n=1 Tax=Chelativorans alearense TaxID=2681495 RepID=UPI0013D4F480|nr:hypothetical protein [Chelativorans alearense]
MQNEVPPKKARQGRRGIPVLVVLVAALILSMIIWGGVEIYGIYLDKTQPVETEPSRDIPIE